MFLGSEEIPTLLHFCAKFGLEKLCWELLECPGGWQACSIRNSQHLTPAEIAEHFGHTKLSHAIKGFSVRFHYNYDYTYNFNSVKETSMIRKIYISLFHSEC